jgi:hypothetical protein
MARLCFFPGGGRGPVGMAEVTTRSARSLLPPNWTPAFAGEARVDGTAGNHPQNFATARTPYVRGAP